MTVIATAHWAIEPVLAASILRVGAGVLFAVLVVLGVVTVFKWLQLRR